MYQYKYGEVLADSPLGARDFERSVFDQAIGLLRIAADGAPGSDAEKEALAFTTRMWGVLIKDLAHPDNDLPRDLRARLMSIGLWVMSEAGRVERGASRDLDAIADVCAVIRDGLH